MADTLEVSRVGDDIYVNQNGKPFLVMSRDVALQIGTALVRVSLYGQDQLDEVENAAQGGAG